MLAGLLLVSAVLGAAACRSGNPSLEAELAKLEEEIAEGQRLEKRLPELERELADLDRQVDQLERVLVKGELDATARLRSALLASGFGSPELELRGRGRLEGQAVVRVGVRTRALRGTTAERLAALASRPLLVVVEDLSVRAPPGEPYETVSFTAALGLIAQES